MRGLLLFLGFVGLIGCDQGPADERAAAIPQRIVSLDYCADQYVLKFVPPERILAVSPDAAKPFSYMRAQAVGLTQIAPRAETILALKPDLIVRSYGGGPNALSFFNQAGIPVLQVGWASDLEGMMGVVQEMATGLGAEAAGRVEVERMRDRLEAIVGQADHQALYMTPGGVTSGPGSLVHEILQAAGYENYLSQTGWHDLPLEMLVQRQPDQIVYARFDSHVTPWSRARHPIAQRVLETRPVTEIEGAWTSCGGWFLVDAIEALVPSETPDSNQKAGR